MSPRPNPFQKGGGGAASPFASGPEPIGGPPPIERRPAPSVPARPGAGEPPAASTLTSDMLGYIDETMHCENCLHFDGQSACDRFSDRPVSAEGGCKAFEGDSGADLDDGTLPPADDDGEMEMPEEDLT